MTDPITRLNAALEGRYRVERELGAGGMATVYLAEDLRHDRKVALKVLKPELAAVVGAERFLAEIKTTAKLQHPHILPLHDSGEADSFLFYVMPYIEGETLRQRLEAEQQLPVEEAISIAEKIASALQYAHEQGVVHRDIKPANILMSRGEPLVADFGIALAVSQAGGGRITETGLSLGTPHYMSPEQAAGERALDKRSDVYALGCVLYEMLTARPPFGGPNAQAVLGRILTGEADRVTEHRRSVPVNVEAAVHKSLERLPADRFEGAGAFASALRDPAFGTGLRTPGGGGGGTAKSAGPWRVATVAASAVALVAVIALLLATRPGDPPPVRRYSMELSGQTLSAAVVGGRIAISPDGSHIVYFGVGENAQGKLWLRARDQLQSQAIQGTDYATMPTFSPDGSRLAFGTRNSELAVMTLNGEPPLTFLAPGNQTAGLDWGPDDRLYYAGSTGILRVPVSGGEPEQVTQVDSAGGEYLHMYPEVLPDGRGLLYTSIIGAASDDLGSSVVIADLETGEVRDRMRGVYATYSTSGHLLVVTDLESGRLVAVPFDPSKLEFTGDAVALTQGIGSVTNGVDLAVAGDGTLVYRQVQSDGQGAMTPVVVRRDGTETVIDQRWSGTFGSVGVSPSGDQVAVSVLDTDGEHIWIKEFGGGPAAKRTFEGQSHQRPEWTPDGQHVVFYANRQGGFDLWKIRADGSQPSQLFLDETRDVVAAEISPDGEWLVYRTNALQAPGADILAKRLGSDGEPEGEAVTLVGTSASERTPTFSPDGRWFAYVSDESGRDEIYVRPFPDAGTARWQVSVEGGIEPLWSRSGDEIYFRSSDGNLVAASVRTEPTFAPGERRPLFPVAGYYSDYNHRAYDVLPGDSAFVMLSQVQQGVGHLVLVENLFTELAEKTGR